MTSKLRFLRKLNTLLILVLFLILSFNLIQAVNITDSTNNIALTTGGTQTCVERRLSEDTIDVPVIALYEDATLLVFGDITHEDKENIIVDSTLGNDLEGEEIILGNRLIEASDPIEAFVYFQFMYFYNSKLTNISVADDYDYAPFQSYDLIYLTWGDQNRDDYTQSEFNSLASRAFSSLLSSEYLEESEQDELIGQINLAMKDWNGLEDLDEFEFEEPEEIPEPIEIKEYEEVFSITPENVDYEGLWDDIGNRIGLKDDFVHWLIDNEFVIYKNYTPTGVQGYINHGLNSAITINVEDYDPDLKLNSVKRQTFVHELGHAFNYYNNEIVIESVLESEEVPSLEINVYRDLFEEIQIIIKADENTLSKEEQLLKYIYLNSHRDIPDPEIPDWSNLKNIDTDFELVYEDNYVNPEGYSRGKISEVIADYYTFVYFSCDQDKLEGEIMPHMFEGNEDSY